MRGNDTYITVLNSQTVCMCLCVCVLACVRERKTERKQAISLIAVYASPREQSSLVFCERRTFFVDN